MERSRRPRNRFVSFVRASGEAKLRGRARAMIPPLPEQNHISHTAVGSHAESRMAKERACRASAGTPCIATRSRHREAEKSPHLAAREQCSGGGMDMQAVQHVELCFQQVMSAVPQEEAPAVSQCWQKKRQRRRLRQEETVVGRSSRIWKTVRTA